LSNEQALVKGVEASYEILFYFVVMGVTIYEIIKIGQDSDRTKEIEINKQKNIDDNLTKVEEY